MALEEAAMICTQNKQTLKMIRDVHNGDKIDPASLSEAATLRILGIRPRCHHTGTASTATERPPPQGWKQPLKYLLPLLERHHRTGMPLPNDDRIAGLCGYASGKTLRRRLRELMKRGVFTVDRRGGRRYVAHFNRARADL